MKIFFIIGIFALLLLGLLLGACAQQPTSQNTTHIVGGDRDAHGCIPSAGYTWCDAKQKCLRTWEEPCNVTENTTGNNSTPVLGGDRDAHGCIPSAGYTWCDAKQKCLRTWEEPCNVTENTTGNMTLANPASVNCVKKGGKLEIRDTPKGQIGVCHLNGSECEEWALFRGEGCVAPE